MLAYGIQKERHPDVDTVRTLQSVFRFMTSITTVATLDLISLLVEMNYVLALWELTFFLITGF